MYLKLKVNNLGDFYADKRYWSSSEKEAGIAWIMFFFNNGMQQTGGSKHYEFRVRPISAF